MQCWLHEILEKDLFFVYDKTDYKGSSNGICTNQTFINTKRCDTIPNVYMENRSRFTQPQALSQ